jgi:hypothetical protein
MLALARLRDGDTLGAQRAATIALPLFMWLPPPSFYTLRSVAGVAEVALAGDGDRQRQAHAAGRALRRFALIFPIGRPQAWLFRGRLRLLAGDERGAARAWLRCIAEAGRLGMPYEAGLAYLALAGSSRAPGPVVAGYAERAAAILDDLAVAYDRPRLRSLATGQ